MNTRGKAILRRFLPRAIGPRRIRGGPLRGAYLVTSWHDYPAALTGRTERRLLDWFASTVRPGDTWLDVGAHYGYTALALARLVGPAGRVFAFEPMLGTAGHLTRTRSLNHVPQIRVVPLALGDPPDGLDAADLPVRRGMIERAATSLAEPWTERILSARLDWLWPRISEGQAGIDGIKIDVQGMELGALGGMQELLRAHRPRLAVEVHAGVERRALLQLLDGCGYVPRGVPIEPVAGETEPQYLDDRSYAFESRPA
jgi:FkbM family methyltransferase